MSSTTAIQTNGEYYIYANSVYTGSSTTTQTNLCGLSSSNAWETAINSFICAIETLLADMSSLLTQYASVIATIVFGIGISTLLLRKINVTPWVGRIFRSLI